MVFYPRQINTMYLQLSDKMFSGKRKKQQNDIQLYGCSCSDSNQESNNLFLIPKITFLQHASSTTNYTCKDVRPAIIQPYKKSLKSKRNRTQNFETSHEFSERNDIQVHKKESCHPVLTSIYANKPITTSAHPKYRSNINTTNIIHIPLIPETVYQKTAVLLPKTHFTYITNITPTISQSLPPLIKQIHFTPQEVLASSFSGGNLKKSASKDTTVVPSHKASRKQIKRSQIEKSEQRKDRIGPPPRLPSFSDDDLELEAYQIEFERQLKLSPPKIKQEITQSLLTSSPTKRNTFSHSTRSYRTEKTLNGRNCTKRMSQVQEIVSLPDSNQSQVSADQSVVLDRLDKMEGLSGRLDDLTGTQRQKLKYESMFIFHK